MESTSLNGSQLTYTIANVEHCSYCKAMKILHRKTSVKVARFCETVPTTTMIGLSLGKIKDSQVTS